jgi:hypothetical protein
MVFSLETAMTTPRNVACPCGSGKKFKRCCGAAGGAPVEDTEETDALGEPRASKLERLPWVVIWMVLVDIGAGIAVGTYRDAVADGAAVTMALLMATALFAMIRKPPSSTGRGGGTAINYGLGGSKPRNQGPSNRRQRRRK